jgi:hypothetical protein
MSLASPYFKKDIKVLEDIQRYATKMISGIWELSYPARLAKLKLPTLGSFNPYTEEIEGVSI